MLILNIFLMVPAVSTMLLLQSLPTDLSDATTMQRSSIHATGLSVLSRRDGGVLKRIVGLKKFVGQMALIQGHAMHCPLAQQSLHAIANFDLLKQEMICFSKPI